MLSQTQPLDSATYPKLKLDSRSKRRNKAATTIKSERMGSFFDDILENRHNRKISLITRLGWKWRRIKDRYTDIRFIYRNQSLWRKTINGLRPWEGYSGLISVMQTHLRDYIAAEEKCGHAAKEYKETKIATAKETLKILTRLKSPDKYIDRRRDAVKKKYPEYKHLVTRYSDGSTSESGKFLAYGAGWVGEESGNNPRAGYFEFVSGRLQIATSPDSTDTDRLLAEIRQYNTDIHNSYQQAEVDAKKDFDRLAQLLKENLHTWWD